MMKGFRSPLPSYSIVNTRVGLSGDKWSASLFVDNATNQPRTFGTQVNYRF